ncbi:alpha/beta hydrolase [Parahaliea aestuarii]|uniref:Alpha/beta hydrolase n=1 Tax=Parahaliea aestuarii TaxID=1852021 RepID=A0A5C9A5S5_9GAMM|nr:alpha/beta hydrolase [Parahaliea aestuarii]TXS94521.1 alpha/beta hydrolase [Parahaliea aestuarii]
MFVITNRVLHEERGGLDVFGHEPNPCGPNELRLVEVSGKTRFTTAVLADRLSRDEVESLARRHNLPIDTHSPWYASLRVACAVYDQARREGKHILLLVHGYNNDLRDVFTAAVELEALYNVLVVPFSWPANGGGAVSGTLAYKNDKDDARSSATALHRAVGLLHRYHALLTAGIQSDLMEQARRKHPANPEQAQALFSRLLEKECCTTLNLLCHSMGNYLVKYASMPGDSSLRQLVFDNIALIAADANNPGHELWVPRLQCRNRLYVVINENDYALKWSRRKPGGEQRERLGQHTRNLLARNANYVDVTDSRGVGSDHSYFRGKPVSGNAGLKRLFQRMFEGGNAETSLTYHADRNLYRL